MTDETAIEPLIERLRGAAARLRAGDLPAAEAARLVEECAEAAVQAGSELERRVREGDRPQAAAGGGQDTLTGPRQDPLL